MSQAIASEYSTIKRNGYIVPFDEEKISNAISKAVIATNSQLKEGSGIKEITDAVVEQCKYLMDNHKTDTNRKDGVKCIHIHIVQDIVERKLYEFGYPDIAKAYILYRKKRSEIRNTRDSIYKSIKKILSDDAESNDTKRENANIDGNSAMGTMLQIGSSVSKNYYLNNMISEDIAKAHSEGYIHIHDLDFYKLTVTCCQIDFEKLLKGGFNTGHGYLREPQSIGSYATLAAIAIQSDQNDCHRFCGINQK